MSVHFVDAETIRDALQLAARAPSLHNGQPWLWRVDDCGLDLFADAADPNEPGTVLSCGVTLNHCVVALAALGWQSRVHHLPDGDDPPHLARIEVYPREPDPVDIRLAAAIPRRRTDRRHYSDWPVSTADVALMGARAARLGVMLRQVDPFDEFTGDDHGVVLALGTEVDDRLARLRAGEATSVVLLSATALGLASCAVIEPLQLDDVRATLRRDVFGVNGFPQLLIRVGWAPVNTDPLPPTPRRDPCRAVEWMIAGDRDVDVFV